MLNTSWLIKNLTADGDCRQNGQGFALAVFKAGRKPGWNFVFAPEQNGSWGASLSFSLNYFHLFIKTSWTHTMAE